MIYDFLDDDICQKKNFGFSEYFKSYHIQVYFT